jgi:Skp family chaperone for outer membrane proteins
VKNKVLWAVGALALGASVIVGSTLWAQGGGTAPATPPPQAPQVKVAFINLAYVLKHSAKWNALMDQMKNDSKNFEEFIKARQQQIDVLKTENNEAKTPSAKKDENVATMTRLTREIEDKTSEARKALAPKSEANMVTIYGDIQDAAARYAMSNGFEIVLQYQDGFTPEDYKSPMNIIDKMRQRGCLPLWYQQGNDISLQVVNSMNEAYKKLNPTAATGTSPGSGSGSGTAPAGHQE